MSILQLINHPKTFLKDNAVWVANEFAWQAKGVANTKIWPVTLRSTKNKSCKKHDGAVMSCWEIGIAKDHDMALAYYLPYVKNHTKEMTINSKARLFLTDTLDGCTFAYNGGGAAKVAHLNYTLGHVDDAKIDQTEIDQEVNRLFPTGASTLKKGDYQTATMSNVTVIGVLRDTGAWEFIYQKRDYKGLGHTAQDFELVSVHRVR
jgi:hypothetical protein